MDDKDLIMDDQEVENFMENLKRMDIFWAENASNCLTPSHVSFALAIKHHLDITIIDRNTRIVIEGTKFNVGDLYERPKNKETMREFMECAMKVITVTKID